MTRISSTDTTPYFEGAGQIFDGDKPLLTVYCSLLLRQSFIAIPGLPVAYGKAAIEG